MTCWVKQGTADNRNNSRRYVVVAPRAALHSWPMCRNSNSLFGSETASAGVPLLDDAVLNRRRLTVSPAESHPVAAVVPAWQLRAWRSQNRRRASTTRQARSELPALRRRQRRRPPRRKQATTHRRKRRRHRRKRRTAATSPRKVVVVLRRGMTLRQTTKRESSVNWQVGYIVDSREEVTEVENKGRSRH